MPRRAYDICDTFASPRRRVIQSERIIGSSSKMGDGRPFPTPVRAGSGSRVSSQAVEPATPRLSVSLGSPALIVKATSQGTVDSGRWTRDSGQADATAALVVNRPLFRLPVARIRSSVHHLRVEELNEREEERYARQIRLPELGAEGQRRLKASSALIIGAGGLGSPVSIYLTAAGVGRIGLVDFDKVDVTNLHRQILYGSSDIGLPKLDRAASHLSDLNPEIAIEKHNARLTSENALP